MVLMADKIRFISLGSHLSVIEPTPITYEPFHMNNFKFKFDGSYINHEIYHMEDRVIFSVRNQ